MKRLTKLVLAGFVFPLIIQGQDLTGIWRGIFYNPAEVAMGYPKYRYEVQIDNNGRDAKGVTYSYQTTRFYGKANLVGVWSPNTKNLVLQEDKMLELKITGGGDGCLMTCYLTYRKEDGKEYLEGSYTSANMNNKNASCGGGKVFLEKVPDTDFELEPFLEKKNSKGATAPNPKIKPGQEDYLVNKPPTKANPTPPANKPPVNKPQGTTKSATTKPPSTAAKPPASTKPSTPATKPPAVASKPPASTTKPANPVPGSSSKTTKTPGATAKTDNNTQAKPTTPPRQPEPVVKESGPKTANTDIAATEPVKPKPLPPPPPALKERKNELFKTITTSERMIEVSFYDNGEIDGDTISVYNNNRLVTSRKGLSAKPVTLKVELNENEPQQDIVMVAENLGSIPPNTALMIVKAGEQRYTLNISSTEQKNAMVRFVYKPD
ncbi:MAG: hypothetical protein MUE71_04410 [Chitinophagaceae bacterium]|nr:hypothetical protein [Chitinophagaceae bacterium]